MVFCPAAPAIDILIQDAGVAGRQIGDDEARVGAFRADFDAGDDALDATPTFGAVEKFFEAPSFAALRRSLEARLCAGFKALDMPAQRRCRATPKMKSSPSARHQSRTCGEQ